ncbi:hypothetical protein CAPTEDRAFT_195372, partial [Capitella teleta]
MESYCQCTASEFTKVNGTSLASNDFMAKKHKVLWSSAGPCIPVPFMHKPFLVVTRCQLECHHGKKKKTKSKEQDHQYASKKRRRIQPSKKVGCPAKVQIVKVAIFPDFEISVNARNKRDRASKLLRCALAQGESPNVTYRVYAKLPKIGEHKGHGFDEYSYRKKTLVASTDQERVGQLVGELEKGSGCRVFFRPYGLLFMYQSEGMRHLVNVYANSALLLDANYKVVKYEIPFFQVVVQTNCGFQVAAVFIVQHEDGPSIAEALGLFRRWNCIRRDPIFVIDHSIAELNAITNVWPDSQIFFCIFPESFVVIRIGQGGQTSIDARNRDVVGFEQERDKVVKVWCKTCARYSNQIRCKLKGKALQDAERPFYDRSEKEYPGSLEKPSKPVRKEVLHQ